MTAPKELQKTLADFLSEYDEKKVTWGVDDCTMFAREWVKVAKGIEIPFVRIAGKAEAIDYIRKQSGLENIWRDALGQSGFHVGYDIPQFGDIGIIETRAYGDMGAIFAHGGIAAVRELTGGWRWFSPRSVKVFWDLQC